MGTVSKKHKVILIGDSNIREYVYNLKPLLNSSYELYSVIRPGASTNELKDSAKEEISQLSYDDVIVICYGTNDYEVNNFSLTLQNIVNFLTNNNQTNIILMNLPYRYDLPNSTTVNKVITNLNRKLQKLVKAFPHTIFLETNNTRILFTNRGLHMNKLGKQIVNYQIASLRYSTFAQNITTCNPRMVWDTSL